MQAGRPHYCGGMWRIRAFCLWTIFVFGVLIKNMITSEVHTTQFKAVHIALAVVSVALAVSAWPLAARLRRTPSTN